jgi:cobalt/nickel transport system permease protein
MADIKNSILHINSLEDLTQKNTIIHRIEPTAKLITTLFYMILVISYKPYEISGLLPFTVYPVLLMTLGELPFFSLIKRLMITLPFTLLVGISNIIFNKEVVLYIWNFGVTEGMISFCSILIKTVLTVFMVLILISTTSMNDIIYTMIDLRIPSIIALQIMMTYRYISVLLDEVSTMYHAYRLRAPKEKGIKLKDMTPFLGQLILRSFDRAERIYNAMKCRGFSGDMPLTKKGKLSRKGLVYILTVSGILLMFRLINISEMIGDILVNLSNL